MNTKKNESQVVSKQRVIDHGEVYTHPREVNAMLDLVKQETQRIESRFLEPACGTGNFLIEILARKLAVIKKRYARSQYDYERYAVLAISSIYGIDILEDNVAACRQRLFDLFDQAYIATFKTKAKEEFYAAILYILNRNIICGDALTLKTVETKPRPIIFSEWSLVRGAMIKRRDFAFHELLISDQQTSLFLESSDTGKSAFIPEPVKEFPLIHYLRVADANKD